MEFEVLNRNDFYGDGIVFVVEDLIAALALGSTNRFQGGVVDVFLIVAFRRGRGGRRREIVFIEIVVDKAIGFLNAGVGLEIVIVTRLGEG